MATPYYQVPSTRLFAQNILSSSEVMRWEDRPHKIVLLKATIWFVFISIIWVAIICATGPWGLVYGIFWIVFGLLPFILAIIMWKYTLYGVTNERVLWQRGFLGRSRESVPFDKIINVGVNYGFTDRIVGCGTITFSTAGGVMQITRRGALGGGIIWHAVRDPDKTERLLREIVEEERKRKKAEEFREMARAMKAPEYAPTAPPTPPPPPPESRCPTCGRPLTYVQQYQRWYCENCRKYA